MAWARVSRLLLFLHLAVGFDADGTGDLLDVRLQLPGGDAEFVDSIGKDKCLDQLHSSLEKLRKRQASSKSSSLIDLSGYALHQSLRNAPVEMYVTDIKVRTASVGSWVQVQKCQFSRNAEMRTHLLFNDLLVSGVVRLMPGDAHLAPVPAQPSEFCTMTLRLRRAGLDLRAAPDFKGGPKSAGQGRGLQLRTESNFLEPHFLSVHAYGCKLDQWSRDGLFPTGQRENPSFRSTQNEEESELRIISLGDEPDLDPDPGNEPLKQRIITFRSPAEKLAAVLSVKKHIEQNANSVFQTHGPFSQFASSSPLTLHKPLFTSNQDLQRPGATPQSTITELDETLRPIGHVPQQPFASLVSSAPVPPKQPPYSSSQPLYDVSSEMEDVFLRGAKALLAKYLEKQLEVPLKEALMTKIGYTVSYG